MLKKTFTNLFIISMLGIFLPSFANAQECQSSVFETSDLASGLGNWNGGGSDCSLITSPNGLPSIRLRDNSASSHVVSNSFDLQTAAKTEIKFTYLGESMEPGEDFFLEYSTDGGASYTMAQSWASGSEFQNDIQQNEIVTITTNFTANTRFRFRCDASTNYDKVYISNIVIERCDSNGGPTVDCPTLSANIGDPCDDADANTENDIVQQGCLCAGTPVVTLDCPVLGLNVGDACTDGNPNTNNDTVQSDCSCAGTPVVTFDCPALGANVGDTCDDNNSGTTNDMVLSSCTCAGTPVVTLDCPALSANVGDPCNDNNSATTNDEVQSDCSCAGTPVVTFDCPALGANVGDTCDDNNSGTTNDMVLSNCTCAGTPVVTLDCPALSANVGDPCNDNNSATTNDEVQSDCSCAGTPIQTGPDCPTLNVNFGTPCNDGNPNTLYDVIRSDCNCLGSPIVTPDCVSSMHDFSPFDTDFGSGLWNDGGIDCSWRTSPTGSKSVRLRDNSYASTTYTNSMNFSGASEVEVSFNFTGESMETGEDFFLEYSLNGGSTYTIAQRWISGTSFFNDINQEVTVAINTNFSSTTRFRFRCDASSNFDKVYIDDITITKCQDQGAISPQFDPFAGLRPVFRTIDGTLNNFVNPEYGTVGQPLAREIPAQYGDGNSSLAGPNRPNPRHVSNILSDEPQDRRDERLLSGMAYQFGQFLDHDIVLSETGFEFAGIPVPDYDPVFAGNGVIPFTRTAPIPGTFPREQPNGLTSYIDGSNVYGVDAERSDWLRTFQDGKLKTSKGNLLPYNTIDGEFDSAHDPTAPRMERDQERNGTFRILAVAGDFRANEHPNLTAFHLIFVREHNRICDNLKSQGMTNDEAIYQKARKLVGAMLQRIVYKEFIPAFGVSLNSYNGYNPNVRPEVLNTFATAAYRWHTMVENDIILRNDACEGIGVVELPLKTIFSNPEIIRQYGPGVLLRGLAFHPQYRTDLKVNNGLRNFLFGQGQGLDLVSINLQRGRDHGLPDYRTVRSHYGGSYINSFSQINSDPEISNRLQKVYNNVNDIDLWAGIFAEPLESGTSLPRTAIQILKRQFEVLRDGDFYFYQNDPFLSSSDRNYINSSDLATIIERNTSARDMPDNIFFKPPCDESDPLEDLNDHEGKAVCTESGAKFFSSCSSSFGTDKGLGNHYQSNVFKIEVRLGYAVRIFNHQGSSAVYTDDSGCLPPAFSGSNIQRLEVICLSNDPSTIDCTGFAGALFTECWGSPLPIFTTGMYNTEQLKSLSVENDMVSGIRVNNGFRVTLYEHDNFEGASWTYVGPTIVCLPFHINNKMSSMEVVCLSDPDRSNCGFNGVAGAVFSHDEGTPEMPGPNDHIGASLGVGDFNQSRLQAMGLENDDIEKVAVNNGYAITLFEHDNFGGNYKVLLGDEAELSTTVETTYYSILDIFQLHPRTTTTVIPLENSVSSIKVRCIEGMSYNSLAAKSNFDLGAEKKNDTAELTVTHNLTKTPQTLIIKKYDGQSGEFVVIEERAITTKENVYTIVDNNLNNGDNVYRATIVYADGSEEDTELRIVKFNANNLYTIFPNPAVDVLNVDLKEYVGKNVDISLYNILGNEIAKRHYDNLQETEVSFDLTTATPGTYLIRVDTEGRRPITKQFSVIKP